MVSCPNLSWSKMSSSLIEKKDWNVLIIVVCEKIAAEQFMSGFDGNFH